MLKYIIGFAIVYALIIMFGSNVYKKRVIEDYETRLPRLYQSMVNDCNELKGLLDLQDRSSREPFIREKINEMVCKYARYYRKEQNKKN